MTSTTTNGDHRPLTEPSTPPPILQRTESPSNSVDPTQARTAPESETASKVPNDGLNTSPTVSPTSPTGRVPFKDQVIAFAKKTRGTVLRKPTLKEHGDQILSGEASAWEPTRKG